MPTEEKDEHLVRCLLCGDRCWFDDRIYHRVAGWGVALAGWLLPVGLAGFLDGPGDVGAAIGLTAGGIVWLAVLAYLFLKQTVWVCRTCGAMYPAQKVEPRAGTIPNDDVGAQGVE
jgi:hypothetical protein